MTTWTKVTKASGTSWTKVSKPPADTPAVGGGSPIGLLLALTYGGTAVVSKWTKVAKATGTAWTKITKAT